MPDNIDPGALTRSDSLVHSTSLTTLSSKINGISTPTSQKASKSVNTAQRIDLEPLYAGLKTAIGDNWGGYKEAISLYVLGHLNQNELSIHIDHYVCAESSVEHLHNQLISAIYGNVPRDLPDQGVAPWVSANDKPTVLSKPVSGDAAEQRLKTEVMQLAARDRRRLKEVPDIDLSDSFVNSMAEYHQAKNIRLPDTVPASAGGLNKTNWDLEIRKRYSQPLASETGEFPDTEAIHGRMVPICYEESLVNGCAPSCAEFMATATEQFIKEVLSGIYGRTRSNIPASSGNGVLTQKFKRQLEREEEACLKGEVIRGQSNGMLPVEVKEAMGRKPLGTSDLTLALEIGDCSLGQMPAVVKRIMGGYLEGELEDYERGDKYDESNRPIEDWGEMNQLEIIANALNVGHSDEPSINESDWGWEGGGGADRQKLNALLDECLAFRQ